MSTWLPVFIGLLLRIGIPLAVTVLIIYLLGRLDRRWQKEARAIPLISPEKACWEIKGCPPENQKACAAAAQPKIPCWQVFRSKEGILKETCLGCEVFRRAPAPMTL